MIEIMYKEGKSLREIERVTGISRYYIKKELKNKGLDTKTLRNRYSETHRKKKYHNICQICNKEFEHYSNRKTCSKECHIILSSNNMDSDRRKKQSLYMKEKIKNGFRPAYNPKKRLDKRLDNAIDIHCKNMVDKRHRKDIVNKQKKYPIEFNKNYKNIIMNRDNFKCQLCNKSNYLLNVHHIDYNGNNLNPNNLITLCVFCHGKTNNQQETWIKKLNEIMVKKALSYFTTT